MGDVYTQLSIEERRRIERWRHAKVPVHEIARELKRSKATVHREIKRNFFSDACMTTPLQFAEYLNRALEAGFRTGQKPITPDIVSATLAPDFDDLEPRLTRQGYSDKVLADQFQSKPAEIKRFLSGQLEPARTRELAERMRMAGLLL